MFELWYAYDDTLAAVLGVPGLGEVPFWIWGMILVYCIFCSSLKVTLK
jgi:hypothetical protein